MTTLKLNDYTKIMKTAKFELGRDYALIVPPNTIIDSRIGYFRAFAFVDADGKSIDTNNGDIFSNPSKTAESAICDQTYDIIHQDLFNIIYFKFMPISIFMSNPFTELIDDSEVANAVFKNRTIDMNAQHYTITDDLYSVLTY